MERTSDIKTMPTKKADRQFFVTLDGIRGMAAVMVVMVHCATQFGVQVQEGYLAVDIFFVLSGIVIANAYESRLHSTLSTRRFLWMRVVRLYPLYLVGTFLGTFVAIFRQLHETPPQVAWSLGSALLMLPTLQAWSGFIFPLNVPAWSLFFELVINAVYAFCLPWLSVRTLVVAMIGCAAGLALALVVNPLHILNVGGARSTMVFGFFRVGYSFFAGVVLYRAYRRRQAAAPRMNTQSASPLRVTAVAWGLVIVLGALLAAAPSVRVQPFYEFVAVTLIFPPLVYAALWCQPTGISARVFTFLGAISYAVYAIHRPLGMLIDGALKRHATLASILPPPVPGILFLGSLFLLCWWLDRVYDAPVRKWLLALAPSKLGAARALEGAVAVADSNANRRSRP